MKAVEIKGASALTTGATRGPGLALTEGHLQNFVTHFTVDQTPEEVFAAINNVCGWWSEEITGETSQLGDIFTFHYKDIHRSTQKIMESIPGKKVAWLVSDAFLSFAKESDEWNGTTIVFKISQEGGKTRLDFTHVGLVPAVECFQNCAKAWNFYVGESLHSLIVTGEGQPNRKENRSEGE